MLLNLMIKTPEMLLEEKTITLQEQGLTFKAFKNFSIKTKNNSAGYIRENINELQQFRNYLCQKIKQHQKSTTQTGHGTYPRQKSPCCGTLI